MGFVYKADQFSEEIAANTKITVSFSITPDNNFHVYNVGGGRFLSSVQTGGEVLYEPSRIYVEDGSGSAAHFQETTDTESLDIRVTLGRRVVPSQEER